MTVSAEDSVAEMIGASFTGAPKMVAPTVTPVEAPEEFEVEKFGFDAGFQTKIAAHVLRDDAFMRRCSHLIKPDFFEDVGEAAMVNIALRSLKTYRCLPDRDSALLMLKEDKDAKVLRGEAMKQAVDAYRRLFGHTMSNGEYVEDKVVQFVKHQAMGNAIMKSLTLRDSGEFDKIETLVKEAVSIGANENGQGYNYRAKIGDRTIERLAKASGVRPPRGITTGVLKLDELLYHRGWGRKELTSIMGGPKAGKTTALINFANAAAMAGFNVLYATLEVGADIISDRLDANISETLMKEIKDNIHSIKEKVELLTKKAGELIIHEYPSGTLSPAALQRLLDSYKSPGRDADGNHRPPIKFDLIVVDYADIMAPNYRTNEPIENSKSVYIDLRAIAFNEDAAVLTATQSNREGFKATVAKMDHVSDDFNKVRTVDLMISINKTEEEAKRNEARLYFAASRNQEAGFTVVVKQNIAMMKFIDAVLGVE